MLKVRYYIQNIIGLLHSFIKSGLLVNYASESVKTL